MRSCDVAIITAVSIRVRSRERTMSMSDYESPMRTCFNPRPLSRADDPSIVNALDITSKNPSFANVVVDHIGGLRILASSHRKFLHSIDLH